MDPVEIGDVMNAFCVGVVMASKSPKFVPGDWVSGLLGWQSYAAMHASRISKLPQNYPNPQHFLGVLGISGLTAYMGLKEIGQVKPGETLVVSAAAGAVGELVVGLGKIWGARVIGIAGSDEKCKYVKEVLGADDCIDYKKENVAKGLKRLCPNGVDVYFDNVGGEILDIVLSIVKDYARIVCCGAISGYNTASNESYRLRNYPRLIIKRARMEGFIYFDFKEKIPAAVKDLMDLVKNGKLKFREDFLEGIDNAPSALQRLLTGGNIGKVMVRVKYEKENIYQTPKL
jgi:NADPH-dependent curcumin reductase CurA